MVSPCNGEAAMRRRFIASLVALSFATTAFAQQVLTAPPAEVRLRGAFVPLLAPEGETRPPTGEVRMRLEDDGDIRVDLVVSGMTETATGVTLHLGEASQVGEQVARMDVTTDGREARIVGATARLTPLVAERVRAGEAFMLVRTNEHPDGWLRAALAPQARSIESVAADN